MASLRGERFHIPLDEGHELIPREPQDEAPAGLSNFPGVGEVIERSHTKTDVAPPAPSLSSGASSGFPAHKRRSKPSRFKLQNDLRKASDRQPSQTGSQLGSEWRQAATAGVSEREQIHQENVQRLADMTEEEIQEERSELFAGLSPALIERLLRRSRIDEARVEECGLLVDQKLPASERSSQPLRDYRQGGAATNDEMLSGQQIADTRLKEDPQSESDEAMPSTSLLQGTISTENGGSSLQDALSSTQEPKNPSIHFPSPPKPRELDPNSPTFLTDLHQKYFPNLEHDPSKMEWLRPLPSVDSALDRESPYHPSQSEVSASSIRFDFNGALLAPQVSREISTLAGLHHHGDAPEAAGYTIPELAQLSRSRVSSQRCIAFQTLGRILHRLGRGEFGDENRPDVEIGDGESESHGAVLAQGLWKCVESSRVLDALVNEANNDKGHVSARAYAQEALWNWRKGGGRMRKAG